MPIGQFRLTIREEGYIRIQIPKSISDRMELRSGDKINVTVEKVEK